MRETVYQIGLAEHGYPLTIALVADLHGRHYTKVIRSLATRKPDIIAVAGDFMYGLVEFDRSRNQDIPMVLQSRDTLPFLSACAGNGASDNSDADRLTVVTTIFPLYDWIKNIVGDETDSADITMLLDSGVDLHSFQPTVDDILKISTCDVFVYVGGESDKWVDDALAEAENEDMVVYTNIWAEIKDSLSSRGFILRYLEGKEDVTGYSYEPWHIRYVGDPAIAKEITEKGITLEEYLESNK